MSIISTKEDIYEIMTRFEKSGCSEIHLSENDVSVTLVKGGKGSAAAPAVKFETAGECLSETKTAPDEPKPKTTGDDKTETDFIKIKSPIVGVFYASPKPDEEPYVSEGQKVKKGDVMCLVEAMKMMNELKSTVDGIVKKVYGVNGQLAQFDELLFEVEEC